MAWSKPRLVTTGLWAATAALAVGAAWGGFWLGSSAVSSANSTRSSTPSPTPTPTPSPVTSLSPGTYDFDELLTGTCLDPFVDAWQRNYDVVACTSPHAAQVIRTGQVPGYSPTGFSTEAEVQRTVLPLCTAPGVIEAGAAQTNPSVVVTFSFPVTPTRWRETGGAYWCFAANADGSPLTGSLVPSAG